MSIWNQITQLAHLKMNKAEEDLIFPQVQNVINFFNHISKVPTEGIDPLITPLQEPLPLRQDEINKDNTINKNLLDQIPSSEGQFIKVPLVVRSDQ